MTLQERLREKIDYRFLVSFVAAWTLLLMFIPQSFNADNMIYAIGEMRTYNHSLFNGNVYVGNGVISPRYIIDIAFDILMHLNGGDWAGAALIWIYIGAAVQSVGIANIAYRINKKYQMVISALFTCAIAYCDNYLAGFNLIALESTSIGLALAFSFLSLSFLIGEEHNYKMSWIFAACSVICHIHEGIYCCAVIFMIALVDSIVQKRILLKENTAVVIAVLALMAVVIPSLITDSMELSNADFVYIYSIVRHPHHLVPSTWGIDSIYKTIWIDVSLFLLSLTVISITKPKFLKVRLLESGILLSAWYMAVLMMYVFTEINPVAFISTLFFSKSFKYVLLMGLIWMTEAVVDIRDRGCYLSSYLLIYYVFTASSSDLKQIALIIVIIFVLINIEEHFILNKKELIKKSIVPIADILFFLLMICIKRAVLGVYIGSLLNLIVSFKPTINRALSLGFERGIVVILVFFMVTLITLAGKWKFKGYKFLCTIAFSFMLGLSLCGRIVISSSGSFSIKNGERALRISMGDDLYDLAENFKSQTDVKDEFLADPDDTVNTGWFQVVCQRNCYVVYKVIPSSRCTVDDWYDRYMEASDFGEKNGEEIEDIMMSKGIKYVLVNSDNYSKLDEISAFSIFMSSSKDLFRIYQLN